MTWRLLTHPHLTLTRAELERDWCIEDVKEAHAILDELDDYRARNTPKG